MQKEQKWKEIKRFSGSGKTFFFNSAISSNGEEYLIINALWGKGNQQRIVLFQTHMLPFAQALAASIAAITGFQPVAASAPETPEAPEMPEYCPGCGCAGTKVYVELSERKEWVLRCKLEHCEFEFIRGCLS